MNYRTSLVASILFIGLTSNPLQVWCADETPVLTIPEFVMSATEASDILDSYISAMKDEMEATGASDDGDAQSLDYLNIIVPLVTLSYQDPDRGLHASREILKNKHLTSQQRAFVVGKIVDSGRRSTLVEPEDLAMELEIYAERAIQRREYDLWERIVYEGMGAVSFERRYWRPIDLPRFTKILDRGLNEYWIVGPFNRARALVVYGQAVGAENVAPERVSEFKSLLRYLTEVTFKSMNLTDFGPVSYGAKELGWIDAAEVE